MGSITALKDEVGMKKGKTAKLRTPHIATKLNVPVIISKHSNLNIEPTTFNAMVKEKPKLCDVPVLNIRYNNTSLEDEPAKQTYAQICNKYVKSKAVEEQDRALQRKFLQEPLKMNKSKLPATQSSFVKLVKGGSGFRQSRSATYITKPVDRMHVSAAGYNERIRPTWSNIVRSATNLNLPKLLPTISAHDLQTQYDKTASLCSLWPAKIVLKSKNSNIWQTRALASVAGYSNDTLHTRTSTSKGIASVNAAKSNFHNFHTGAGDGRKFKNILTTDSARLSKDTLLNSNYAKATNSNSLVSQCNSKLVVAAKGAKNVFNAH